MGNGGRSSDVPVPAEGHQRPRRRYRVSGLKNGDGFPVGVLVR